MGYAVRVSPPVEDQFGNAVTTAVAVSLESEGGKLVVLGSRFVAKGRGKAVLRASCRLHWLEFHVAPAVAGLSGQDAVG